jgi:hypothetical protein
MLVTSGLHKKLIKILEKNQQLVYMLAKSLAQKVD